ncbi:MAG TPA: sigma-70 family RNA polymerase sigma factor [Ktedonobacteraceae bacterium]|nr:sigma-70 family RNA polymerase sigma factor [Ktedonobacteraceae bacterium]
MYKQTHTKQEYPDLEALETSENILIAQTFAGDNDAFESLVRRYQLPLFHFINHYFNDYEQIADILQYVFLQLYVFIPKLRSSLPMQHASIVLKAWLYRVAANRCRDELRKKRPILFSELESGDEEEEISLINVIPDPEPLPEEIAELHELQHRIRQAIQTLPPKLRSVVFLRYTRELTFVEIGRLLNMPENTAKTYFQRARPLLRAALSRSEHPQAVVVS